MRCAWSIHSENWDNLSMVDYFHIKMAQNGRNNIFRRNANNKKGTLKIFNGLEVKEKFQLLL